MSVEHADDTTVSPGATHNEVEPLVVGMVACRDDFINNHPAVVRFTEKPSAPFVERPIQPPVR